MRTWRTRTCLIWDTVTFSQSAMAMGTTAKKSQDCSNIDYHFKLKSTWKRLWLSTAWRLIHRQKSSQAALPKPLSSPIRRYSRWCQMSDSVGALAQVWSRMVAKYTVQMWEIQGLFASELRQTLKMVSFIQELVKCNDDHLLMFFTQSQIGCTTRAFSRDHKPDDPEESKVIIANNGRIDSYRDQLGN